MALTPTKIEVSPPKRFTGAAVLAIHCYNVLLVVPLFAAMLVVSLMRLSVLTLLIPILTLVATAYVLPFGLGNAYVARLVRSLRPTQASDEDNFIVQVTVTPRLRSGLRALVEDADDVGWLSLTASELLFHGDALKLSVPWEQIREVSGLNVGIRGRFVYGGRICLRIDGLPNVEAIEIAERGSYLLPTSKKVTYRLYDRLRAAVAGSTKA